MNSWEDFFEKPDDRIAVWTCLFVNGADEQKSASLIERARGWRGRYGVPQNVNPIGAVVLKRQTFRL